MPTTNKLAPRTASVWLGRVGRSLVPLAWIVNIVLLVAGTYWVFSSGRSLETIDVLRTQFKLGGDGIPMTIRDPSRLGWESTVVKLGLLISASSLLVMFGSLFAGTPRFRTVRFWLVFTGLLCGWLGLMTAWPEIYWFGQQTRVKSDLAPIASLARELDANWPTEDGEHPTLGMFLAYPKGAPRTMLLLGNAEFPESNLRISAIERTLDGAIRFELADSERGAWLEWRANDSSPAPFTGGLDGQYEVLRFERLAPQWFLVRYRTDGINR